MIDIITFIWSNPLLLVGAILTTAGVVGFIWSEWRRHG